jgi:hypothetical protein
MRDNVNKGKKKDYPGPGKPELRRAWLARKSQIPNSKQMGVLRTGFKRLCREAHSGGCLLKKSMEMYQ